MLAQASSASFRLTRVSLNAAGQESSGATRTEHGSAGQELTIGTSSSPHFVLQAGFWSFLGSGLVPVLLTLEKHLGMPAHPDLMWSGNNPPYTIYRSQDCAGVFGSQLAVLNTNSLTDDAAYPDSLTCYNVLATAPGPLTYPVSKSGATSP